MKNLILLFILFSSFYSSQEYYFDYKCYDNETQLKGRYKGIKEQISFILILRIKILLLMITVFHRNPKKAFSYLIIKIRA